MTPVLLLPDETRKFSDVLDALGDGDNPRLTLREMVEAFGERGFGAVILMLALMALIPWPPGGKAIFSVPIILISAELALQSDRVWLPRWLMKASVSRTTYRTASQKILKRLRQVERLTRPRLPALTGEVADVIVGALCILLAMMMALPVPFGDALPGIALVLLALGIIQRDGVFIILGLIGATLCAIYLALVWTTVIAIFQASASWLAGLF
ncbi:exopolysaccharide biosynthesis protein [Brevundimonas vesicularis]|uniref:exopolysaccharide biosynthesis protein n=1 Tax=Brevundimonas vesicularis TaxID=41276 RepID=UPI0038D47296